MNPMPKSRRDMQGRTVKWPPKRDHVELWVAIGDPGLSDPDPDSDVGLVQICTCPWDSPIDSRKIRSCDFLSLSALPRKF